MSRAPSSAQPSAEQPALWRPRWLSLPGPEAARDEALVDRCIGLYGEHYGTWGQRAENPGAPVRIPRERFLALLAEESSWLSCAFAGEELIGYCVAVRVDYPSHGRVAWVSQLVVHETYRNARVATRLLYSVWHFSDCFAWGLLTANPFAVRALETATRRPCRAALIAEEGPGVLALIAERVPYVRPQLVESDGRRQPRVDTRFFIDHTPIEKMREMAAREDRRWALGGLGEGEEWLGLTFADQLPAMADERLGELLDGADEIWLQAYEGMTLDENHTWHASAGAEVELIAARTALRAGASVLDVGCGDGRHVRELAARGHSALGIEISAALVERARESDRGNEASYLLGDAREELPGGPFDLAISLYDVLGSSASIEDDRRVLRHVAASLRPGAHLVASVMNDGATAARLPEEHRPLDNAGFIAALERLPASQTMERTGDVFDPKLLLSYRGAYYRKEQFQHGGWSLRDELVVRDRRFTSGELEGLLTEAGFVEVEVTPVQSGHWERLPPLPAADPRAKELLVIARTPAA